MAIDQVIYANVNGLHQVSLQAPDAVGTSIKGVNLQGQMGEHIVLVAMNESTARGVLEFMEDNDPCDSFSNNIRNALASADVTLEKNYDVTFTVYPESVTVTINVDAIEEEQAVEFAESMLLDAPLNYISENEMRSAFGRPAEIEYYDVN